MAEYEYLKLVYVLLLTVNLIVALEGYTGRKFTVFFHSLILLTCH